jgi:MerR family transcriptional regulator, light-induced transcriptional regulator
MSGLPIREVAEQTGLTAGTIRMWEQRYGFPRPERTPAGYRLYHDEDVELLRRVVELRGSGLSVPAALERARSAKRPITEHPTIFGAMPHQGRSRRLRKKTLIAMSRAIEDQTMASAARPIILGAFQRERHYRTVEHRYRRMAQASDLTAVFAAFDAPRPSGERGPHEVEIEADAVVGHEWAVVVDAPGFAVCLSAWEPPVATPPERDADREFETFWTLDPDTVRQAAHAGAVCARPRAPEVADRIEALLDGRPQAPEATTAAVEALSLRMVSYLERA